jgi:hypothetical protein
VILPVGEDPPASFAVSRIALPDVGAADAFVDNTNTPGVLAVATGCAAPITSVTTVVGAGAGAGAVAGAGAGQFAIVRLVDPELELRSRVSAEVHDEDAFMAPSPLRIGTVSDDVFPGNDVVPWITRGAPLAGVNTISHAGAFSPASPVPDALKSAQSKVTDPQVAVAVTVCVCAAALAAKIASIARASPMARRERRLVARRLPILVVAGARLSLVMLALLFVGRALDLRRHGGKVRTRRISDEELCRKGRQLRRAPDRFPTRASGASGACAAGTAD